MLPDDEIDADPLTRETLVRMLQRASYDVVGVSGGGQALRLLDDGPFDLAITNASMSEHDRLVTSNALRHRSPKLRVMTVSPGTDRDGRLHEARSSAASPHLVKPFDTEQLLQAIKRVLQD